MALINFFSHSQSGLVQSSRYEANKPLSQRVEDKSDTPKPQQSTVTISGKALLLSRLFKSDGLYGEPKIDSTSTTANTSGSVYSFLTDVDIDVLSKLYEMATTSGETLEQIDNIAFDLAHYRRAGPGGPIDTTGLIFDKSGQPIISEFNPGDEAIAQRVLTSKAMSDTSFDRGFLLSVFTPGKMPVHASDFSFLEKAVYAFSVAGYDGSTDPDAEPVVRPKKEDFQALVIEPESIESGMDILASRVFSDELIGDSEKTANHFTMQFLEILNEKDKEFLGKLYASAQDRMEDLTPLDNLAFTIANFRKLNN